MTQTALLQGENVRYTNNCTLNICLLYFERLFMYLDTKALVNKGNMYEIQNKCIMNVLICVLNVVCFLDITICVQVVLVFPHLP